MRDPRILLSLASTFFFAGVMLLLFKGEKEFDNYLVGFFGIWLGYYLEKTLDSFLDLLIGVLIACLAFLLLLQPLFGWVSASGAFVFFALGLILNGFGNRMGIWYYQLR